MMLVPFSFACDTVFEVVIIITCSELHPLMIFIIIIAIDSCNIALLSGYSAVVWSTQADCPEVTLCVGQNIEIQLLTN